MEEAFSRRGAEDEFSSSKSSSKSEKEIYPVFPGAINLRSADAPRSKKGYTRLN